MQKLTQISSAILLGSLSIGAIASEDSPFSATMTMTSDYMFRGVSQSDNNFAIQGSLDYAHDSGFFLGAWASNVDFKVPGQNVEVDLYLGYGGELSDDMTWQTDYTYFEYPNDGNSDADFGEFHFGMGFGFLSTDVYYSYDAFGSSEDSWYFNLGSSFDIMEDTSIHAHVGTYLFDDDVFVEEPGTPRIPDSYWDYGIGIATQFYGLDMDLSYLDTDSDAGDIFGDKITDGRVVFTISKSI